MYAYREPEKILPPDGGPAFPQAKRKIENYMDAGGYGRSRMITVIDGGMSLRDYFAAMTLNTFIRASIDGSVDDFTHKEIAQEAYRLADAMLAERNKGCGRSTWRENLPALTAQVENWPKHLKIDIMKQSRQPQMGEQESEHD